MVMNLFHTSGRRELFVRRSSVGRRSPASVGHDSGITHYTAACVVATNSIVLLVQLMLLVTALQCGREAFLTAMGTRKKVHTTRKTCDSFFVGGLTYCARSTNLVAHLTVGQTSSLRRVDGRRKCKQSTLAGFSLTHKLKHPCI